ncbi:MAG: hypothetical protein JNL67_05700 [Planctomycetaceae bacterium]|nr:hypothetical protein [Planctomycetaceae bacterium]
MPSSIPRLEWKQQRTLATGLVLVAAGVLGLVGNLSQLELLRNSCLVVLGVILFGFTIGGFAGWLIGWTDVPRRRLWLTLLLTWAMTPLVVQLAAWDSLWGRLSWLSALNQVTYAAWFKGLAAVVWVQAFASIPWFALLMVAARDTVSATPEEEAQLQLSLGQIFVRVSLRRHMTLFVLIAAMVGLRFFEQIEVSDVYQIRTWPEVWYLGFALGQFEGWGLGQGATSLAQYLFGTNLSPDAWGTVSTSLNEVNAVSPHASYRVMVFLVALVLGSALILWHTIRRWLTILPSWDWQPEGRLMTHRRWAWTVYLFAVLGLPQIVIWTNLVIRSGLRVSQLGDDTHRVWSITIFWQRLVSATSDYWDPMMWSWLIGVVAAIGTVTIALCLGWWAYRGTTTSTIVILMAIASLIIPAPLVSVLWYRLLNQSAFPWLDTLAQTSILGPCLAIGLKQLGWALLATLVLYRQQPKSWREDMAMSGQGAWSAFWHLGIRIPIPFYVALLLVLAMSGAGDLSASFATLPAGLDTFPRRLLGDLHSGAGGNVAAACLLQIAAVLMISSMIVIVCFRRQGAIR